MIISLLVISVLILSSVFLYLSSSSSTPPALKSFCSIPGPILLGRLNGVNLAGLQVIPIHHLLPIIFSFRFLQFELELVIQTQFSELVIEKLQISGAKISSKDVGREIINILVDQIEELAFRGSFGTSIRIIIMKKDDIVWRQELRRSGRAKFESKGVKLELGVRLMSEPIGIEMMESKLSIQAITKLELKGFGLIERFIPLFLHLRPLLQTIPKGFLSKHLLNNSIRQDSKTTKALNDLIEKISTHLDYECFAALTDDERELEFEIITREKEKGSWSAGTLNLNSSIIGPTRLINIPLADYTPELYRPGGTRAKLQSFNLLTEEFELKINNSEIRSLSLTGGSIKIKFENLYMNAAEEEDEGYRVGELSYSVSDFQVVLSSAFDLRAKTSEIVRWTTGFDGIVEQGTTITTVTAANLKIKFSLIKTGSTFSTWSLSKADISSFDSILPVITLTNTPAIGTSALNFVSKTLQAQIAATTSFVISNFLENTIKDAFRETIEEIDTRLLENGIEF